MQTRTFPWIVTAVLLSVTLFSCDHDPERQEKPKTEDPDVQEWDNTDIDGDAVMSSAMAFHVAGGNPQTGSEATLRGSVGTDHYVFALNDLVTINITGKGKKVYKVTDTADGTLTYTGTATDAFLWNSTSENIAVTAWSYGSGTEMSDDPSRQAFSLETNQRDNGYQELLYMAETTTSYEANNGKVNIDLEHMLSRVVITVNQDAASAKTITAVTMGSSSGDKNLPTSAVFTPANAKKWTSVGTEKGVITPMVETANSVYSAVLIPTTYEAGLKLINITIGGETFAYVLPDDTELLAGKQYNYTITVKNRLITFSVTVTDWTTTSRTIDFSE